jgi:hypothetical protein
LQKLAIVPDSDSYYMWVKPSPKPYFKVYIFNYTNVPEFESKEADKLNVKELGPYVYEVSLDRVNVRFNGSQVTYQERRVLKFMPHMSNGRRQNDRLVVPNIPLFVSTPRVDPPDADLFLVVRGSGQQALDLSGPGGVVRAVEQPQRQTLPHHAGSPLHHRLRRQPLLPLQELHEVSQPETAGALRSDVWCK